MEAAATSQQQPAREPSTSLLPPIPQATSIIIIGMAGSGKSTFTSALSTYHATLTGAASHIHEPSLSASHPSPSPPYMINLDPAVGSLHYEPNVDIRDTVDYRRVMQQYNLGPNGGILTALNLFTTKFDQVLAILEKRAHQTDHILLDTPGQIEIFTWSASGSIVTDALASAMPTVVAYIIDTPRTTAPATFMSNMLYACSILYKTKLPFILVFNKTDAQPHDFALEWMADFEKFQEALRAGNATEPSSLATGGAGTGLNGPGEEQGYMNSLMNSMSLVLDEFYKNLRTVGVSSLTGAGLGSFFDAVQEARQEYIDDYRPDLERLAAQRQAKRESEKRKQLEKLMKDMKVHSRPAPTEAQDEQDDVQQEPVEEEYDGDGQIIEPDSDEEKPHYDYPGPEYDRGDGTVWPRPGG